jgi:hypothetical protein
MNATRSRRALLAGLCAALAGLTLAAAGAPPLRRPCRGRGFGFRRGPVVTTDGGAVRGAPAGSSSQQPDARSAAPYGCPAQARVQSRDVTGATRPPDPRS